MQVPPHSPKALCDEIFNFVLDITNYKYTSDIDICINQLSEAANTKLGYEIK